MVRTAARCAIPRATFLERSDNDRASLQRVVAEFPNARYVEAAGWFCGVNCTATRAGLVLYYDQAHVSASAASAFADQCVVRGEIESALDDRTSERFKAGQAWYWRHDRARIVS